VKVTGYTTKIERKSPWIHKLDGRTIGFAIGQTGREEKSMNKLTLIHKGRDSWDRPVYECEGRLYVDVDPRDGRKPEICTKLNNEFDGEPDTPIEVMKHCKGVEIEFIPCRDTW
jgi:hypothetical protein